jgi:iron uptake system component EfeO
MKITPARIGGWTALAAGTALTMLGLAACGSASDGAGKPGAKTVKVALTDQGCTPAKLSAPAGPVTFEVSNSGTSAVTEMELKDHGGIILGERENIVAGLSGSFSLNVKPGTYTMNCPNGDKEDNGVLTVTGKAQSTESSAFTPLIAKATSGYRSYVEREVALLLAGTHRFVAALERGDTQQAKELFGPVRRHYEAIEPVAESFENLDAAIDARVNDVANPKEWTGFHRIEQTLWTKNTTNGTASYAKKLLADVTDLNGKVKTLDFQAPQLANGAVELLNEVATSKITGEEDRYSHTDLSDFEGNLTGARVAFELLRPALVQRGDGELAQDIAKRFEAVQKGLDSYRRSTPLGFADYGQLTKADRLRFAQQVDALAEPLSTVASKLAA